MSAKDARDTLCVVLDLDPVAWQEIAKDATDPLTLESALESVLVFCNGHLALRDENEIVVLGATATESQLLYSSAMSIASTSSSQPAPSSPGKGKRRAVERGDQADTLLYEPFRALNHSVSAGVREMMARVEPPGDKPAIGLVGALAKALCHINRVTRAEDAFRSVKAPRRSRILVLSLTPDSANTYIALMNVIFSAQKATVPIDVCKLSGAESEDVFMQQAASLTGGVYLHLDKRSGLLQYLFMAFVPGVQQRHSIVQPKQERVDLRAACFCHRKIVEVGYVCSVCLSIFCAPVPLCSTCKTRFNLQTYRRLQSQIIKPRTEDAAA